MVWARQNDPPAAVLAVEHRDVAPVVQQGTEDRRIP